MDLCHILGVLCVVCRLFCLFGQLLGCGLRLQITHSGCRCRFNFFLSGCSIGQLLCLIHGSRQLLLCRLRLYSKLIRCCLRILRELCGIRCKLLRTLIFCCFFGKYIDAAFRNENHCQCHKGCGSHSLNSSFHVLLPPFLTNLFPNCFEIITFEQRLSYHYVIFLSNFAIIIG